MPRAQGLHSFGGGLHKRLLKDHNHNNDEVKIRKNAILQALLTAGLIASAPLASAANLVFCSEGSPAGFDPGLYTTLSLIHI